MKYPESQFELLKKSLSILKQHFEIEKIHPCQLHYMLYQQASSGQTHNALFVNENNVIVKGHSASKESKALINFLNDENFELYPYGCNDNHIETAVKAALKSI